MGTGRKEEKAALGQKATKQMVGALPEWPGSFPFIWLMCLSSETLAPVTSLPFAGWAAGHLSSWGNPWGGGHGCRWAGLCRHFGPRDSPSLAHRTPALTKPE